MILAEVGGAPITLKDLTPISPSASTEQDLRADMYTYLLNRAIERELTFQTAKARGVQLGTEDKQALDTLRTSVFARDVSGYTPSNYDAVAQAEFEVRDREAQMLQNALMHESGPLAQYVTSAMVQDYYDAHSDEFPELPRDATARKEAWQGIEAKIRESLIPAVNAEHETKRRLFLEDLKANAAIDRYVTIVGWNPREGE